MKRNEMERRSDGSYISPYDWSDLKELYVDKQYSTNDIAKIKGCTSANVCVNLRKQNIVIRKLSDVTPRIKERLMKNKSQFLKNMATFMKNKYRYDDILTEEVLNNLYVKQSLSVKHIAEIYHCGYSTIKKRLVRYNIPLQNMSDNNPMKRPNIVKKNSEAQKKNWDANPERREINSKILKNTWIIYRPFFMERAKEWRKNLVVPKQNTSIEVKVQGQLRELGYDFFTHQYRNEIEHSYQCDIFVPSLNLVIECDGNYWHNYPTRTDIDNIRTEELLAKGFKVLRLWEIEIKQMSTGDLKIKLKDFKGGCNE